MRKWHLPAWVRLGSFLMPFLWLAVAALPKFDAQDQAVFSTLIIGALAACMVWALEVMISIWRMKS